MTAPTPPDFQAMAREIVAPLKAIFDADRKAGAGIHDPACEGCVAFDAIAPAIATALENTWAVAYAAGRQSGVEEKRYTVCCVCGRPVDTDQVTKKIRCVCGCHADDYEFRALGRGGKKS